MNMETLAQFTQAAQEDQTKAAKLFLKRLKEKDQVILEHLLDAATWKERDLASFDDTGAVIPILGPWGRFYFVTTSYQGNLEPRVTPRGLKALAQGLVDVLAKES